MDPIHIGSSLADGVPPRGLLDFFESMNDPSQLVELVAAAEYQLWDDVPGIWDDGGFPMKLYGVMTCKTGAFGSSENTPLQVIFG